MNKNPCLLATGCYTTTYTPPDRAFWSINVYGADGYMKPRTASSISQAAARRPGEGLISRSKDACGEVSNRFNGRPLKLLARNYRPGPSVLDGNYKLPAVERIKA